VPRKRASPTPPAPTAAAVEARLRAGEPAAAVTAARDLFALTPTADHRRLLRRALAAAATRHAEADAAAFAAVMAEADALDPDDPDWAAERAILYARGGDLPRALALAGDAPVRAKVLAHAADRAVRLRDRSALPAELHAGYDAVVGAFRRYEAGDDEAARAALQPIGLTSPFLEWKGLLRGLIAHAAGDDAAAAEHWRRLSADRLPARLAVAARRPADDPLVERLRLIQKDLGRDQPMSAVWRHAEAALPMIRRRCPGLEGRLAGCLYRAIVRQGQPADIARYRSLFGPPADDPHFHRLEALACEDTGDRDRAAGHWLKYEQWLAAGPPGWPPAVARRARAVVLHRAGRLAEATGDGPPDDFRSAVESLLGGPPGRRAVSRLRPEELFRRSSTLAPDWPEPARRLFAHYRERNDPARAEAVARDLLARRPDDLPTLEGLAELLGQRGRAADALAEWRRVLAANPLDRRVRVRAAHAYHAAARRLLIDGDAAAADALLADGRAVCEEGFAVGYWPLASVAARKLGRRADADAAARVAAAVPGGRLAAALYIAVDSGLAKLKPGEKTAANKALAAALAAEPTPLEANLLYAAWDAYHLEGVTYRGQKTQEKKVHEQVERSLAAAAPADEFERLVYGLVRRQVWRLAERAAARLERRFPDDPAFKVLLAEAMDGQQPRFAEEARVRALLKQAKEQAERSADPRHRPLLDRIDRLQRRYAGSDRLFEFFFADRR
jgi:hypothetical protein